MKRIIVFDVGATNIKWGILDEDLSVSQQGSFPTPLSSPEDLIGRLVSCAKEAGGISGIAVSILGTIEDGAITNGGNLPFMTGYDLEGALSQRLCLPVNAENDGKCNLIGEFRAGRLKGCRNCVSIVLGTGVGAGIIIDGKLYRGSRNNAGEVGYSYLRLDMAPALEGVAGYRNSYMGLLERVRESSGVEYGDTWRVFREAEKGDLEVLAGIRRYSHELAGLIWNLFFTLDPERICIGGGIARQKILTDLIREETERIFDGFPLETARPELVFSSLGNDANLFGAARAFFDGVK